MEDAVASDNKGTSRPLLRSIVAVLAGLFAVIIVTTITDIIMHATGVFPAWFQPMANTHWALALGYRLVYGIGGPYLTARLAPSRPMAHALTLGVVGLLLSLAGVLATWNKGPEFGPKWYPVALVVTALPMAWVGGALALSQLRKQAGA